jgi:hypothetical protein
MGYCLSITSWERSRLLYLSVHRIPLYYFRYTTTAPGDKQMWGSLTKRLTAFCWTMFSFRCSSRCSFWLHYGSGGRECPTCVIETALFLDCVANVPIIQRPEGRIHSMASRFGRSRRAIFRSFIHATTTVQYLWSPPPEHSSTNYTKAAAVGCKNNQKYSKREKL